MVVSELAWRELSAADLPTLHALVSRIEDTDNPPYRSTIEDLSEYFDSGHHHLGTGAFSPDGALRAFAFVRLRKGSVSMLRIIGSGGVDPDFRGRGLGSQLIGWQVENGTALIRADGRGLPGRIIMHVDEDHADLDLAAREHGFAPTRWYAEMRRDLRAEVPEFSLPRYISIEPWTPQMDEAVRQAHNKAFVDHWDAQPRTAEAWSQGRTYFAPEWSFIALDKSSDRAKVIGYLLSSRYEQDWPALGWSEGYTELLGVLPEYRHQRIATALLAHAMAAYRESGMEFAGIDSEADAPEDLGGPYGELGYEVMRRSAMYTIEVEPAS